jgi:hypothetical protein
VGLSEFQSDWQRNYCSSELTYYEQFLETLQFNSWRHVFAALMIKIKVFCDMISCWLVNRYRSFREDFCLHLQGSSINILKMMNNGCTFSQPSVTNHNSKSPFPKEKGFTLRHNGCINLGSRNIKLFVHHIKIIHGYASKYQNSVVKVHRPAAIHTALNLRGTL